jgi:hypothetical protein
MDTLTELKQWILDDPDARVGCLDDADFYLVAYDEQRDRFLLPAQFIHIKPVIEAFAGDSLAFAKWVREFARKYFFRGSEPSKRLSAIASSAQSRGIMRRRRLIIADAVATAVRSRFIQDTTKERQRYAMAFNTWLRKQYASYMKQHRATYPGGRMTSEDRESETAAFWEDVNQRILSGDLPKL